MWKKGRDDDIVYREIDLYHAIIESGCRMNIREVNENDIEAIGTIYVKAFGHSEGFMKYCKRFGEYVNFCVRQNYAFIIENEIEICGVVLGYEKPDLFDGRNVYIELLAVLPEYQCKGYGKALVAAIEETAISNGIKEVTLRTACYMDAFHIYNHWGFKDTRDDQRYMVRRIKKDEK